MFNHECDYKTELDDTKFCYQLIITLTKSVIFKALLKSKNKKFQDYFLRAVNKNSHLSESLMARTVQFLRHDAYYPVKLSY